MKVSTDDFARVREVFDDIWEKAYAAGMKDAQAVLAKKARALPHMPRCKHRTDPSKPCTCPSAVIAGWLEMQA